MIESTRLFGNTGFGITAAPARFRLRGGCGVIGQQIEIVNGEFAENVYCRGQMVVVNPSVKMAKELNVVCQLVDDRGATITGGITGSYSAKN